MNSNNDFYVVDTEERIGMYTSKDGNITEQYRVIQDKSGLWLCQSRFYHKDRNYTTDWQTTKMYKTREEAIRYFKDMPDWVKKF